MVVSVLGTVKEWSKGIGMGVAKDLKTPKARESKSNGPRTETLLTMNLLCPNTIETF